jgi:hypothetical protein
LVLNISLPLFILWSSCQSPWLQIQRSGFDSRCYQIFWGVVGLECGPLCLVSTIEELLRRKSSGSGLESRKYDRKDPSRWPRGTFYSQKLALTSPISGGSSAGIVRSRTEATEFVLVFLFTCRDIICTFHIKDTHIHKCIYLVKNFTSIQLYTFLLEILVKAAKFQCCCKLSPA